MIFHDSLSYVATLVKHFQFDINTFNNNNNNNILDNKLIIDRTELSIVRNQL